MYIHWCGMGIGVRTLVCVNRFVYTGVCNCVCIGVCTLVCVYWCMHWCVYTGV